MAWTQNIWARHPPKEISLAWSHRMASILGTVVELRARSVSERRQRKRYMGAWSALSVPMTRMRAALPSSAIRYMTQKGMAIQEWANSSPGIPVRKKVTGRLSLTLEADVRLGTWRALSKGWRHACPVILCIRLIHIFIGWENGLSLAQESLEASDIFSIIHQCYSYIQHKVDVYVSKWILPDSCCEKPCVLPRGFKPVPLDRFFLLFLTHILTHIICSFLYFPFYIFFLISVNIPGYFCHYYAA